MADDRLAGGRRVERPTTGRTPFVWVQDDTTGHRYDVLETALRDGMTPVEGVEKNYGRRARPAKYRTDLAGNDATGGGQQSTVDTGDSPAPDPAVSTGAAATTPGKGARK